MATPSNTTAPLLNHPEDVAQERARNFIDGLVTRFEAARQCTTPGCTFNNIRGAGTCENCGSAMSNSIVGFEQALVSAVLHEMAEEAPFVHPSNSSLHNACAAATGLAQDRRRDPLDFWRRNSPQGIIDEYFRALAAVKAGEMGSGNWTLEMNTTGRFKAQIGIASLEELRDT
ncbi:uncharacterized protein NECHADRAFT_84973 [Fusarium vanettenii 77-13-4]|uniref:Uncharacterized protein n=1 Tax=Fusarium vanettenii (strain ATCC MYA-4622 / CBS 123669 / FGSC 9596 / NRRL 45880 / 77-13-4) TaxID=660122 RepID=C7YUM4_FUSV7|nr:uncharacterized protein NECHADRAFT_84973 [Fusarium vanettenii 77-13-4]EEU44830.1 predicted protein [Fusarium vanettenii 77-13-4]